MESPATRLRQAREDKGFRSASTAAARLQVGASTYRHHENGTRDYDAQAAKKYARAFGVDPSWLLYGKKNREYSVPIVGYIGAGAEFTALDDHAQGAGLDEISTMPMPSNSVAVKVRGTSMMPVYNEGDVLIYSERRGDIYEFLNRRCVCGLADGRILVKTPTRGADDRLFTLMSFNAPPITDVALEWCAKIEWVQPI